ncbi:MAG: hypothetical protein KatS3mg117_2840 [Geminicoccaceae bacterium]|nr:MAG: hypothetical protein KatS3mg117_2840 [Geminicoccaceae bacterium]
MGHLVAVGNLKGGVGKSTLAVNLAAAYAAAGRSAVLIDTDPQQTAARWAAQRRLPCPVLEWPIRDLAAAGAWVGYALTVRASRELVFVDLPAVLSAALAAACLLADLVLIPSGPGRVDLATLERTLHHLRAARREGGGGAPLALLVPTRLPRPGLLQRRLELGALAALGEPLAPPVHLDPAFEAAFATGRWVGELVPGGRAHRDLEAVRRRLEEAFRTTADATSSAPAREAALRLAGRGITEALASPASVPAASGARPTPAALDDAWPGPLPRADGSATAALARPTRRG